jgi:hypothetical protein
MLTLRHGLQGLLRSSQLIVASVGLKYIGVVSIQQEAIRIPEALVRAVGSGITVQRGYDMYIHILREDDKAAWVCYKYSEVYTTKYSDGTPALYIRFHKNLDVPQTGRMVLFYEGLRKEGDTYVNDAGEIVAVLRGEE